MELRELPSVDELARSAGLRGLPHEAAVAAAREAIDLAREEIAAGHEPDDLVERAATIAAGRAAPTLRRVINATGVVLHTNLGRAPLARAAAEHAALIASSYSNLEYDLRSRARGSRHDHLAAQLRRLTGAEDALAVNNNAAAVLLALAALADGRDVVVSRGELIEVGDGFRIPDVLASSGARLVEVGTTNRTRIADYEQAIGPETAAILRVHQSNFRQVGFTERPGVEPLAQLARRRGVPLVDDLGSGSLVRYGDEPLPRESIAAGVDLVTFSGDKLLGGPQAGVVCGRAELVARLRRHPLQRALRPDKLTLAALEATLLLHADPERALREIPALRMLHEPLDEVRGRAERLAVLTSGAVVETAARAGGGALPMHELSSFGVELEPELAAQLLDADPPVVAVLRGDRTVLDCRTIAEDELELTAAAVVACR
jgi:L-seryl-tRNA(Ser) seleniumtransferase